MGVGIVHIFSIDDFVYFFNILILIILSIFFILKFHIVGRILGAILIFCVSFSVIEYIRNMIIVYKQAYRNRD